MNLNTGDFIVSAPGENNVQADGMPVRDPPSVRASDTFEFAGCA